MSLYPNYPAGQLVQLRRMQGSLTPFLKWDADMYTIVAYVFPGVGGSLIGSRVPKITTFDNVSPLKAI